jgi:hypothetical protein
LRYGARSWKAAAYTFREALKSADSAEQIAATNFCLSMALWQSGTRDEAKAAYLAATEALDEATETTDLLKLRDEAAELLQIGNTAAANAESTDTD